MRKPSLLLSLFPIFVLVVLLFISIRIFGSDALEGASQSVLLFSTAVCVAIAIFFCRVKWADILKAITDNLTGVAPALLILLIIGALSGTWMISGIVPSLIYYGIQIIHPKFFLVTACIICSITSVITGSSWTTVATIGVALIGIGHALGFSDAWTAGAIISGAYFGDKVSPLSDTTILASSITETPLFKHIRYLMGTTIPSMLIALVIFTIAGFFYPLSDVNFSEMYTKSLKETFWISPWLLLVPVLTVLMIVKKVPALITLFLSALLAVVFAVFFQPQLIQEIAGPDIHGWQAKFKGILIVFYGATQVETGYEALNDLVSTGGMSGMLNTIWLIICAMCFGGAMAASGMLERIISTLLRFMKRTVGLVTSTVCAGLFFNLTTADQYISILLTGNMFKDIYKQKGYESRLLSRTIEDSVTVTSPLIPWNTCGMTQATILGVPTLTYLPYAFFNLISPLMSIVVAAIGYKIYRRSN